jgi:DNA-binding CsgD family transcriptional regulator
LLDALARPPAVVVVEGEAGVGKTRLVREALARPELDGWTTLVGCCQPLREPYPFGPVIEALRGARDAPPIREPGPIAGALRPLLPELGHLLPPALEPIGDARAERHRIVRAILEVFRALGPTVCVLEDLHWSDEGTVELLRSLLSQLPAELGLVLTYRREDLGTSSRLPGLTARLQPDVAHAHIRLAPFGVDDVQRLVESILGAEEVSEEFVHYLHERTDGLPFAVEEVLRLLADRRDLIQRDGRWARRVLDDLEVPEAVRDSILERCAGLSPPAQRIARAAAVAGVASSEELLRHVAGLPAARSATALAEALALGLLGETDDGRFGFRHAIAAQAVDEAIPTPERRRLNLRAAQELERGPKPLPLARLAHHFREANQPKKWLRYAETAADLALSLGNGSGACVLLVEALECPEASSATRARLAVKLGRAALSGLDHRRAVAVLRRVLDSGELPAGIRGEVRLYLGLLLDNQGGEVAAGRAEIALALPELRRRPGLAAQAMSVLAVPMSKEGDLAEHLAWMSRAVQAASRSDEPVVRTGVLVNRATVLMHVGDPAAWRAVLDLPRDAESAGERRQLLRASANLAHACACTGHYEQAETFLLRGRELSTATSDPMLTIALDSTSVLLDWATGRWHGLDERARKLGQANDDVARVFAEAQLVLGHLLLAHGELLDAEAHLRSAREAAVSGGAVSVEVAAVGGLARIRLARDDSGGAAEEALGALDVVRRKGIWVWAAEIAPVLTEALVAGGRAAEAAGLVAEMARRLRGRDAPAATAALAVCRALLATGEGRLEQAASAFGRAERAWLRLPRPYEAARCSERRALLRLTLRPEEDRGLLLEALAGFEALGASWDAGRVRRSLRELGVTRPWRGGRRGYGSSLSPRELEVVRLAAAGRTNREIAEALVLSHRTVEDHVAKAMRKLGVSSRRAFAAAEAP